ncbi:MAG: hypothetical protein ACYDA3_13800 [Gaiellaceae bacterium]
MSLVLAGVPASAAVHVRSNKLLPVRFGLPFAKSGQPYSYSVAGAATGGKKPYRCAPQVLHVGSLKLGSNCKIVGTAPVVSIKSITGPFVFKLTDSSRPPKTISLYPLDFTTVAPAPSAYGTWTTLAPVTFTVTDSFDEGSSCTTPVVGTVSATLSFAIDSTGPPDAPIAVSTTNTVESTSVTSYCQGMTEQNAANTLLEDFGLAMTALDDGTASSSELTLTYEVDAFGGTSPPFGGPFRYTASTMSGPIHLTDTASVLGFTGNGQVQVDSAQDVTLTRSH